jgi:hypothetical protein
VGVPDTVGLDVFCGALALVDAPIPAAPPSAISAALATATARYPLMRLMLRSSLGVVSLLVRYDAKPGRSSVMAS